MIQGTVMFSGNDRQPCFADYKAKLYHSSHIQHVAILISENATSNSTFVNNNDFTTYTAVKAVLQQLGYGVRFDFIDFYYLHPRDKYSDEVLISRIPVKWNPSPSDYTSVSLIERLRTRYRKKATKTSYNILVGQDDFYCGEPYFAARDFEQEERTEKYKELCDFFEL
ncbi:hypothetical protein AB4560_21345 [Vibrio sp. 10N.222.51.C12]|uniref:hypothetical protein n=1 Tax=Vibrio sp. 10N.222.51.C12 TaxID=3229622 RepID=UPI003553EE96